MVRRRVWLLVVVVLATAAPAQDPNAEIRAARQTLDEILTDLEGKPARVSMNVDGISEYSSTSIEILDERFNVITGYSKDECEGPEDSGLFQKVKWEDRDVIEKMNSPIRIRVNFEGIRPEDLKVYAVYIQHLAGR